MLLTSLCLLLCCLQPVPAQPVQAPLRRPAVSGTLPAPRRQTPVFETFPANVAAFRLVNAHHSPAGDVFFTHYYWLGNGYILLPVAVLVYIFRRQKLSIVILALVIEAIIVNLILKPLFDQPRPLNILAFVHVVQIPHIPTPHWHSFPSGDASPGVRHGRAVDDR